MVTSFDILVKLAGVPTAGVATVAAKRSPVGVNAPDMASVAAGPKQPSMPAISTPKSITSAVQPGAPAKSTVVQPKLAGLDARSALLGLGAGVGGFAAGKAFVEPALQGAASVSPWLIGALSALVVGSIAANSARQDERQKLKLQQALDEMTPAERIIALENTGQQNLDHAGFRVGPGTIPSENMSRSFY